MTENEFDLIAMRMLADDLGLDDMDTEEIKERISTLFWQAEHKRSEANDIDWEGILLSMYLKEERGIEYDYN